MSNDNYVSTNINPLVHPKKRFKYSDLDEIFRSCFKNGIINIIPMSGGTKKPKINSWKEYQNKRYPLKELKRHRGNFGLICGDPLNSGTGHIVVLDIDDKMGEDGVYKYFKELETLQVKTASKGYHIYFWADKPVENVNNIGSMFNLEIELRGSSSHLIMLPPSFVEYKDGIIGRHELIKQGEKYPIMEVEDAETFVKNKLIEAGLKPKKESLKTKTKTTSLKTDHQHPKINYGEWTNELDNSKVEALCELLKPLYTEGQRHNLVLYLSGWMYKAEIDFKTAKKVILKLSKGDEEQTSRILSLKNSYRGLESKSLKGSSGIFEIIEKMYMCLPDDKDRKNKVKTLFKDICTVLVNPLSKLGLVEQINKGGLKKDNLRRIANFIIDRYDPVIDEVTGILYIYNHDENYFEPYDENKFLKFVGEILPIKRYFLEETNKIKSAFSNIKKADNHMIVFNNGILNSETLEFIEPHPNIFSTIRIHHNYNPDAQSELMEKTLQEILCDDSDKDKYKFWLEWVGYCFRSGNPHHLMLFITGEGSNGKSVLTSLISSIFGDYVASVPLHKFGESFGFEPLLNKKVNLLYDLPKRHITDTGFIKAVTGEDSISVSRKYKSEVETKLDLKIIGIGNTLPQIDDEAYGFWRRMVHIELKNQFDNKNKNPHLKEDLAANNENMEWLIFNSIKAYKEVEKNGKWSITIDINEMKTEYLKISDPCLYAAKKLFVRTEGDDFITRPEVVQLVIKFLKEEKLKIPGKNLEIYNAIRSIGGEDVQRRVNFEVTRGFKLITTKNQAIHPSKHRLYLNTKIKLEPSSDKFPLAEEYSDLENKIVNALILKESTIDELIKNMKQHEFQEQDIMRTIKQWKSEGWIEITN